jgi:hypothetical protein
MISRKHVVLLAAGVFLLTALPFARTVGHDLINLDDFQYTVARAQLTCAPLSVALPWLLTSQDDAVWMPLTRLTYLLDCRLWGATPWALHATNVVFHGLNAAMLFVLLLAILRRGRGFAPLFAAAAAALFWALHPLRVEPAAWVASRKDLVSLFFELLALLFWVWRLDGDEGGTRARRCYTAALLCLALSGMAKQTAMTFPVLAALLEWLALRGRLRWRDYAAPAAMALVFAAIAQYSQIIGGATVALAEVPLHGRLLNAAASFGIYCWKTVWPFDLAVQCTHRWPALPRFWAQGLAICAACGAALCWSGWKAMGQSRVGGDPRGLAPRVSKVGEERRGCAASLQLCGPAGQARRGRQHATDPIASGLSALPLSACLFAGLAWFLVAVGPTLGISNFGVHAYADRFTYLPAVGFSIMLAAVLVRLCGDPRGTQVRRGRVLAARACICAALLGLGAISVRQARYWADEGALFEHTLAVDGADNAFMRGILGLHYYEYHGDLATARAHMDYAFAHVRARELESIRGPAYVEVLAESGCIERAREEMRRVLELRQEDSKEMRERMERETGTLLSDKMGYLLHAIVNLAEGEVDLAKSQIETFDSLMPGAAHSSYIRGKIALAEGDAAAAVRHWKKSVGNRFTCTRHRFVAQRIREMDQEP